MKPRYSSTNCIQTLSVQAVVILLPQITKELTIPQTRQQWIISAFALTSGSFLLLCGKLADVYGRRLLFILGCFWITATALGTAFSPVEVCMYIMRALQGLVGFLQSSIMVLADIGAGCRPHYSDGNGHSWTYHTARPCEEL
jgi:MFS family permease